MDQTSDGPAGLPDAEVYRTLGTLLAEAEQRYGVPPQAVEEKAALEARLAVEQAAEQAAGPGGAAQAPAAAQPLPETRWIEGKMETPGVRFFEYEYTLRLALPFGRAVDALPPVRAYWMSRGMDVVPEEDSPAGDVVASPGKGEWALRAGVLDPATVFVRVASGRVLLSSSPPGNEREA